MALKHADIIAQMTLEEKASMCDGLDYWHSQPVERVGDWVLHSGAYQLL